MNMLLHRLTCAAAAMVAGLSSPVIAGIVIPPGLQPGDAYHLAFVSQGTRDATSSDIDDYNRFVQAEAELTGALTENYGLQWSAIASTLTVNARDNAVVQAPVYLLNGTKIADSFADMWDSELDSPHNLNVDQFGNVLGFSYVWTGTWIDGFSFATPSFPADRYLGAAEFAIIAVTIPPFPYMAWVSSSSMPIGDAHRFYGLSEVLTVPSAVPEASPLLCLACAGAAATLIRIAQQRT